MPLYEYLCQNCGHQFERIQKFSDAPIAECPKCGGPVQKLVSSPAFHLKGTGWYATDYARQGDKAASADSKSSAKSETADTKTSTESKPAKESTTSETKPAPTEPKAKT